MASKTAVPSMMAPSTMLSGGTGSTAKATTLAFPVLTPQLDPPSQRASEPMSKPMTAFDLPKSNMGGLFSNGVTSKG